MGYAGIGLLSGMSAGFSYAQIRSMARLGEPCLAFSFSGHLGRTGVTLMVANLAYDTIVFSTLMGMVFFRTSRPDNLARHRSGHSGRGGVESLAPVTALHIPASSCNGVGGHPTTTTSTGMT